MFFCTLEAMENNDFKLGGGYRVHELRFNYIKDLLKEGMQNPTDLTKQMQNALRQRNLSIKDSYKIPIEERKKRVYEDHFDFFKNSRNSKYIECADFLTKYLWPYASEINIVYKKRENYLVAESHKINNKNESITIHDTIISLNDVLSYKESNNKSSENENKKKQKDEIQKYFEAIKKNLPQNENYNNREKNNSDGFVFIIKSIERMKKDILEFENNEYKWIESIFPELYDTENRKKENNYNNYYDEVKKKLPDWYQRKLQKKKELDNDIVTLDGVNTYELQHNPEKKKLELELELFSLHKEIAN
jgi:hypothetical protein